MASNEKFVAFIRDQMAGAGSISARKLFGEFAIYCDETVVAFVCDDQLFVKPTAAGMALIGEPSLAPPYPGAKPHILIDDLDDAEFLSALISATARALPAAKPKKPSASPRRSV
jgi:TfoX/Sxy family transcriptional regulator of competence genes